MENMIYRYINSTAFVHIEGEELNVKILYKFVNYDWQENPTLPLNTYCRNKD